MGEVISMSERRRHERVKASLKCVLRIGDIRYSGLTRNISLAGVYIASLTPPVPAERIAEEGELSLLLDTESITAGCRVVFIGGGASPDLEGVGLAYQGVGNETFNRLESLILALRT